MQGFKFPLEEIQRGTIVLTATRRLARTLQQAYGARQRDAGVQAWPTPGIHTFQGWLEQLWRQWEERALLAGRTNMPPRLMAPAEERHLWERLVRDASDADPLLRVNDAADSAGEAWRLACQWQLGPERWTGPLSEDCRWFAARAEDFRRQLAQANWLDGASLPDALRNVLEKEDSALQLPPALLILGFQALPPQFEQLLNAMAARGCSWQMRDSIGSGSGGAVQCSVRAYAEPTAELEAAARWARALLDTGAARRIGIVVPDLHAQRHRIERVFADILEPALLLAPQSLPTVFNISLAPPLASYPAIGAAMQILALSTRRLPLGEVSALLRSPFLAHAKEEETPRVRFDMWMRRKVDVELTVSELLSCMQDWGARNSSQLRLREQLEVFWQQAQTLTGQRGLRDWARVMHLLLASLGWPGERGTESAERQLREAWSGLLEQLVGLESVVGACSFGAALGRLRRLAQETLFQPESSDAPVQVLGEREAAGLWFDALWVTGNHDEALPAPPRPHPFLPARLQRRAGLPSASADAALATGRRWVETLRSSAPTTVFSYPHQDEGRELRLSPLLSGLARESVSDGPVWGTMTLSAALQRSGLRESWSDERGPPLGEGAELPCGTAAFKHQSACPFRGFATVRLAAAAPEAPVFGLSAAERGTLLHAALERLWTSLRSSTALCALSAADVGERVERACREAVERMARQRPLTLTASFAEMEVQRLVTLLLRWLQMERSREPFEVVQAEQQKHIEIGGVRVRGRIDRVDRLASGGYAVIDYKSGEVSRDDWFGRRPKDPQLPLYGLTLDAPVAALAFAQVSLRRTAFLGFAEHDGLLPGVEAFHTSKYGIGGTHTWPDQWEEWRRDLEQLAAQIRAGEARVDPQDGAKTCQRCDLQPLCRIAERTHAENDPESADD